MKVVTHKSQTAGRCCLDRLVRPSMIKVTPASPILVIGKTRPKALLGYDQNNTDSSGAQGALQMLQASTTKRSLQA
jgi:hypothetical protein